MTFDDIKSEVDTFMFEGHDTTACGIMWTIYLFAKYPDYQAKIREEIRAVLEKNLIPQKDQLNKLPILAAFLKESHRLYPPVPVISRLLDEPVEIKGHILPKGVNVRISPWDVHRNPHVWKDPNDFKPERFMEGTLENENNPFAYIPFAAGKRNCIGQHFAVNEQKTVLIILLSNFRIILDETHNVEMDPKLVLRAKHGIMVRFEKI